jgi:hypothetical protein
MGLIFKSLKKIHFHIIIIISNEIFCNLFLKIHLVVSMCHVFCVNDC